MTEQQANDIVAKLNDATTKGGVAATAIAARIQALENSIKTVGLTEAQETTLLNQLTGVSGTLGALADSLTQMGQTPSNPVPVEPPPAPAPIATP